MAKRDVEKVECQYCGEEFTKSGIVNHEKACSENPENTTETDVDVVINEPIKKPQVKSEVEEAELVAIQLKEKVECYIGDRYYRFTKGEKAQVTVAVKDILKKAGLLEAL